MSLGSGDEAAWHRDFAFWKQAGVTHITGHATGQDKRIAGYAAADHLRAITRFKQFVAELL